MKLIHSKEYPIQIAVRIARDRRLGIIRKQIKYKVWNRIFDSIRDYNHFINNLNNVIETGLYGIK